MDATNQNIVNGYSNRTPVGTSSGAIIRNQHQIQQYNSYQPSHHQQQQIAFQISPEMRRIDENVIRLPRGPDGTSGFMLKR